MNRWADERWDVVSVEPLARGDRPSIFASQDAWRFDDLHVELHRSECEGYYLNVTSPQPKAFVMYREAVDAADLALPHVAIRPWLVTVSYHEAARFLDAGEHVDGVALDAEILAWMQPFLVEHYRPEPRRRSRRSEYYERETARAERVDDEAPG